MTATTLARRPPSKTERLALDELFWRSIAPPRSKPLAACLPYLLRFLQEAKTLDEHAEDAPIKKFPVCATCALDEAANQAWVLLGEPPFRLAVCRAHGRRHKPYVRDMAMAWLAGEINVWEKSRQILGTWTCVLMHTWLFLTREGSHVAFQSLNETKAIDLVKRAKLVYDHLPSPWQRYGPLSDAPKAPARYVEGRLELRPANSELVALPNGAHQVRMYTFTAIFMDEAAMWEPDTEFEESYAAAIPAVKGGGKLTAISSVHSPTTFHYRLARGLVA